MELEGKVAIVTGGTSGLGAAIAVELARLGCRTALAARTEERAAETLGRIESEGGRALFIRTDVTSPEQVAAMVDRVVDVFGRLDIGVNSAGIAGSYAPTHEYADETWDEIVAVNLSGVFYAMKYEVAQMVKQGTPGAIVNMSGAFGLIGCPNMGPYSATRHGVVGLTKSAALEYATQGIRVNAVCAGACKTPLLDSLTGGDPAAEAQFAGNMPINRLAERGEIAQAAVWLCSERSSFVTGHALSVDGGWVAG